MEREDLFFLHSIPYGDHAIILHFFGPTGRVNLIAKGGKASKRKISSSLRPLSLVECSFRVKPEKDLQQLQDFTGVSVSPQFDPLQAAQSNFIAEILYRYIRDDQEPLFLYRLLLEWKTLEGIHGPHPDAHLHFLVHLIQHMGYAPDPKGFKQGHSIDSLSGKWVASSLRGIPPNLAQVFVDFLKSDFGAIFATSPSKYNRSHAVQAFVDYLQIHLGKNTEIKSIAVLYDFFRN